MKRNILLGALVLCLLPAVSARGQHLALSARAGTLGPGIELTTSLYPQLNARLGVNYLPYTVKEQAIEVDSDVDLYASGPVHVGGVSALVDWHPFRNHFRLSGGVYYNATRAEVDMELHDDYTINGYSFSPEKIGKIHGDVSFKSALNPYFGIGIGNAVAGRLGLSLDIGGLYTNAFKVDLTGDGLIKDTAAQDKNLEDGFSSFKFYPVVTLGLNVKLF